METLRQRLSDLYSNGVKGGTIAVCVRPGTKYHSVRSDIYNATSFFPDDAPYSHRAFCVLNGIAEIKKCECGCGISVTKPWKRFIVGHCNKMASVKKKKKQAFREKYGVDNPSQALEVKEAKKKTCQEHYGVDNHMQNPEYYEKYKQMVKETTGKDNWFQVPEVKDIIKGKMDYNSEERVSQISKTHLDSFYTTMVEGDRMGGLATPAFTREEYRGVMENGKFIEYKFKCNECGREFTSKINGDRLPRCKVCRPVEQTTSQIERDLSKYITSIHKGVVEFQNTTLLSGGLELDIRIPDKKLSFEVDGLYYHSEFRGGKHRAYHLMKTKGCEEKGERLIHIFEDELANPVKRRIVYSRIRHILGSTPYKIYARECEVREVGRDLKDKFLRKYHLQGADKSSLHFGLFHKNRLVALMTFGGNRVAMGSKGVEGEWELVRYATNFNFNIVGGADKLLKHFERTLYPVFLKTYADRRWSQGGLYKQLGFELDHMTSINYWYVEFKSDYPVRHYRFKFRKDVLVSEGYDASKSEWEIMLERGFDRVWDCGHYMFVKKYDPFPKI